MSHDELNVLPWKWECDVFVFFKCTHDADVALMRQLACNKIPIKKYALLMVVV